jgi:hypothetical protein
MMATAIRHLLQPYAWRSRAPRRFVVVGVVTYSVVLSFVTVMQGGARRQARDDRRPGGSEEA